MFNLHPQLARDCVVLGELPLCRVLLLNDRQYPWLVLVPRREGVREIFELSAADQQQLLHESSALSRLLSQLFAADKMNVAALGNMVEQLHIHHVVRFRQDAAWPKPVWGACPAIVYTEAELSERVEHLQQALLAADMAFVSA